MESESNRPQCRDGKTYMAEQIHSLPKEIVEEILSRLSVKSLLKLRCVSKSWRSLIDSKRFIKTHLENSTKNASFAHHKIVFLNNYPPYETLNHTSLHSLMNGRDIIDTFEFDDPMYTPTDSIRLVGCCDGLICILIDRRIFFLWNPSTRMYKKLPYVDQELKLARVSKYGFGFDESSGDYKVFAILSVFWVTGKNEAIGKIYSLKTNSWKVLKEKDVNPFLEWGEFLNGKLHWGSKVGVRCEWAIVSFDLKNEVYGIIEQPNYESGKSHRSLGVLEGRLCVLCDYLKTCADFWVMKEYGMKESWEKVWTVPYPCDPELGPFSFPFCIGSKGEILFIYGLSFMIYYPKGNMYRRPVTRQLFNPYGEAGVYVESLVSLVPDDEQEMEIQAIV